MSINQADQTRYAEMSARFEAGESDTNPDAVTVRGTPAGHAQVTAMLLEAADTDEEREHIRNLGGRPPLDPDSEGGRSPLWNVRVPRSLDTTIRSIARQQGRPFSAVIRDAAADYAATHQAS